MFTTNPRAEDVVDLAPTGVLHYSEVERVHKVGLYAGHADADSDQDVQAWQNDPSVLDSSLFGDPAETIGAFIETSRGSTCALVGQNDVFFVLESHGCDPVTGLKCGSEDGRAVILRLEGLGELLRFLRSLMSVGHTATLSQVYV